MSAPVRPRSGVALGRLVFVLLAAASLVTCTEEPTSPTRPGVGTLRVTPQFNAFARLVPLTLDNVRVIVVRPPSDTILRAARSFSPGTQQLTLSLPVLLLSSSEALQVTLELYAGTTLLFTGTSTVQVAAGASTPPASVPVSYQGPGATLTTLTLAPRDTSVTLGATFPFGATAVDGQQNNVPQFYVSWSADNGTIDAAGVFTAPTARDTLYVHAVTPNGVRDSTRVFVTAPPSSLTKTGGDGQSGIVGTRLPQVLAVRVNGSDGQPVPGASVAFTVTTGGGSVDSATATTDAQGIARTGAVLGTSVGQQSYTATVSGIPAAVFTATATGIAPISTTLAAGGETTCEIRSGQTLCWGYNGFGQLGDGTTTDRAVPGPVVSGGPFASIAVGESHVCALTGSGQAFCWGDNSSGAVGDGTTTDRSAPAAVSGSTLFAQIVAGEDFSCGLTPGGQAFCWGFNLNGELGDGTTTDRHTPVAVAGGHVFVRLSAGGSHACGLEPSGAAFCWGLNADGELGDGTFTTRTMPTAVSGGLSFSDISIGLNSSCALSSTGAGFCWGFNFGVQLTSPQPVAGGFTYTALDMGDNHVCALSAGVWRCGGDNGSGQLGDGTTTDRPSPVVPLGGHSFTALAGGSQHTCGRTATATLCWGDNVAGQLGDGTTTARLSPTPSMGPAATAAVSAGNGQTATAGTAVAVAPAIVVRDAASNPVRGLDVVFAVTGGGGSLTGAVTQTDAAGIATVGSWTLGATAGPNSLSATVQVGGVGGNPVAFTATGAAPSMLTWNGSASSVWTDPANWTPATVPTSALDVIIPSGTPNQPTLTTTGNTQSLTIQSGATLTLNGTFTLNVFGDFDNSGLITLAGGVPTLDLRGTTRLMRGNSPVNTSVTGSYTLNGSVTVANAFSISGGAGSLTVGGQLLSVSTLTVGSGGSLVMTNSADVVVVSGNLTMSGSDHTGKLTAGQIQVQGNLVQTSGGSPNSFAASGSHLTVLTGFGSLSFQSPGAAASRFQNLIVQGNPVTLASRVVAAGDVSVTGGLTLNGRTLEVGGVFGTLTAGTVTMTNAADSLLVGGNATFAGGNELGRMSAGVLVLGGDLAQLAGTSGDAFHPSGTHKTVLTAASPTLSFATPGNVPGTSHFQLLDWSGTGTLTLATDVYAHDLFQSLATGATTITSGTDVFTVGGFSAAGPVTINGTDLTLDMPGGGAVALANLTFTNASPASSQLELNHPGTGGPFTFTNLTFTTTPTTGGNYLRITDTDGPSPDALTVNMVNPVPAADGGFSQALNGAVINWPAAVPIITWNGSASSSWTNPSNWTPAIVPTATDDVLIPSGLGTYPVLTAGITVRDLVLQAGGSLNQSNQSITAGGDVDMSGALTGTGGFTMNGAAVTARGSFPNVLNITGTVTVTGPLTATNQLNVSAGDLTLNGNTVTTGGFNTVGSGTVTLTNAIDTLRVTTTGATFRGGNTNGKLTAGVVRISGGGFDSQLGPSAFVSTGTRLLFDGSANQSVANNVGGNSYADVSVNKSGGNFIWAGGAAIGGLFEVLSPTAVTGTQTLQARRIITAAGSSLGVSAITVNSDSLSVGGSFSVAQVNFTAGSTLPVLPYAGLLLQHPSPQAITAAGDITATSFITVGSFSELVLGGHTMTVTGPFALGGGASLLTMTSPLDSLKVTGDANFSGGNLNGRLTAGAIRVTGNLVFGSLGIFTSTGTRLVLEGGATQVMNNQAAATAFSDLEVAKTGGVVNLGGTFAVNLSGRLITTAGGTNVLTNGTMNAAGADVDGLTLDNIAFTLGNGSIAKFDNVSFTNYPTTATQLMVNNTGAAGALTFSNLSFSVVPTTGLYLRANDTDGATSGVLTVNLVNPTPATDGGFSQALNGAVINWPLAVPAASWTGTVSSDWHTGGNWDSGSVPTTATDVTIPAGTPNAPVLSAAAAVMDLRVQAGATVDLGGFALTVANVLDVSGGVTGGAGSVIVTAGPNTVMQGAVGVDLTVAGNSVLAGPFSVGGSLLVQATLNLNGTSLTVAGDLMTQGAAGLIRMANGGEALAVAGNATFDGGDQLGSMTTGTLTVGGNFTQLNTHSGDSFHPSGAHVTILSGLTPTVSFATPGNVPGTSHFQELFWTPTGGTMTILSDVFAHGVFGGAGQIQGTITSSSGRNLHVGGMFSAGTVLDNVQLVLDQATPTIIDLQNVTFTNTSPAAVALTTLHPGVPAGRLTYSNITFTVVPTTGLYLTAIDNNGGDGTPLVVDMVAPTPATDGGFTSVLGATINWPAGGPVITWNGSADTDWFNPANWNGGVAPTGSDNVLLPSGAPNYPDVGNVAMNDLTIQSGASLTSSDHTITVNGNLDVLGFINGCCDVTMTGSGVAARATLLGYNFNVQPGAVVSLNGPLGAFSGTIVIQGELVVNGQNLSAPTLITFNGGLLTMTHPADFVNVTTASFSGGDQTGRLTDGLLWTDSFTQAVGGTGHTTSFFAGGSHQTTITGSPSSAISFASPGSSRFQDLALSGPGGTVALSTDVTAAGQLVGHAGRDPHRGRLPGQRPHPRRRTAGAERRAPQPAHLLGVPQHGPGHHPGHDQQRRKPDAVRHGQPGLPDHADHRPVPAGERPRRPVSRCAHRQRQQHHPGLGRPLRPGGQRRGAQLAGEWRQQHHLERQRLHRLVRSGQLGRRRGPGQFRQRAHRARRQPAGPDQRRGHQRPHRAGRGHARAGRLRAGHQRECGRGRRGGRPDRHRERRDHPHRERQGPPRLPAHHGGPDRQRFPQWPARHRGPGAVRPPRHRRPEPRYPGHSQRRGGGRAAGHDQPVGPGHRLGRRVLRRRQLERLPHRRRPHHRRRLHPARQRQRPELRGRSRAPHRPRRQPGQHQLHHAGAQRLALRRPGGDRLRRRVRAAERCHRPGQSQRR